MEREAGKECELIVIRHGETNWNASGRLQGQSESELNESGRKQAQAVADRLMKEQRQIAAVYSSDLKRALDTAEIIASTCNCSQVLPLPGLRERHLGKLQGLVRSEAKVLEPEAYGVFASSNVDEPIPGGGESFNQFNERARSSLESIAQKHFGECVVVVTHGGILRALYPNAKGRAPPGIIPNTSYNFFRISENNRWSIDCWADVTHLQQGDAPSARESCDTDSA